ncbi:MAG TPA: sortase [Streptosporangiaceae bacterium]
MAGVGVLLYSGYRLWDPFAGARQRAAQQVLLHSWQVRDRARAAEPARAPGRLPGHHAAAACTGSDATPRMSQPFAFIQIPAFGRSWKFTVVQGTTLTQLATGPGHIPGTALPGQAGNVGIAAHDITAGNPFLHLGSLRVGDRITITTEQCVVTYRVTRAPRKVLYTDVAVLRPSGHKHTITLVTCWPVNLVFDVHRIVVPGIEVSSVAR